jgi:acetyl esterase/lipase
MSQLGSLDPRLFRPEAIDAETLAFNAQLEQMLAAVPPIHTQEPQKIRDAREAGRGIFGPIIRSPMAQEHVIPGPDGPLPLRVFIPDAVQGVYLHIHGGGHVLGRAHHSDERNEAIARGCNLAVVSIDYRLAPEHPYPAGPDDCEAAGLWLARHAGSEFGSNVLLIGGESAGAHLAAVTLLRLRDRHSFSGFRGANLVFGVFDLSATPSVRLWGDRELVLSARSIRWFGDHFVAEDRRRDPAVSPLYAKLENLPAALFSVGTLDPLLDDTLFMYSRWIAAGNEADLAVYPGGVHGFTGFDYPLARRANARIDQFLVERSTATAPLSAS